jgi:hypothetical protein
VATATPAAVRPAGFEPGYHKVLVVTDDGKRFDRGHASVQIVPGEIPVIMLNITATDSGVESLTVSMLLSETDAATNATMNVGLGIAATKRAGRQRTLSSANVQRWTSGYAVPAEDGTFAMSRERTAAGRAAITGRIRATGKDATTVSASVYAEYDVECFAPVADLGVPPSGHPRDGNGVELAPDTAFKSSFCKKYLALRNGA